MRSPLSRTPASGHDDVFLLRIKEPARKDAISLSVALKRPDRSFGATADSRTSRQALSRTLKIHLGGLHLLVRLGLERITLFGQLASFRRSGCYPDQLRQLNEIVGRHR